MGVYDPPSNRGGTRLTPGNEELRRTTGMSAADEQEMLREAERKHYDEQFAGIVEADAQRSAAAEQILQSEQQAAKGVPTAGSTRYGLYNSDRDAGSIPISQSPNSNGTESSLYNQEKESGGSGYYQPDAADNQPKKRKGKGIIGAISTTRRNLAIIAVLTSMVGGISGFLQFAVQPFQLPSISQYLEDLKYANFNNASRRAMEHAFTGYIAAVLLPGMREKGCPSTKITRNCAGDITGEGPVKLLWRKMSGLDSKNAAIEYKLALRGIEIQNSGGRFFLRAPNLDNPIDLADVEAGRVSNIFEMRELSRAEVRAEMRRIFEEEGDYKKLLYRMRVGNMLKKYGITRCLVACEFKDRLHGKQNELKSAGLAFLNQRVFETRAGLLGLYLNCMLVPCDDILSSPGPEGDESTMGEPNSDLHRSTRNLLAQLSARFGAETLEAMVERVKDLDRDGLQLHLTKLAIEKLGGSVLGREIDPATVTRIASPIGWVLAAVRVAILISQASQLRTMIYLLSGAAMVQSAELMRTISHEARAGQMSADMLGSTTNIFRHGPFNSGPSLEDSPAWDKTVASVQNRPAMAFMRTLLPQKAYAQAAGQASLNYECNDGRSIFNHQRQGGDASNNLCDEVRLGADEEFLVQIGDFVRGIPGLGVIIDIAEQIFEIIAAILGPISQAILDVITLIPGVQAAIDGIGQWISPFIIGFFQDVLKDPLGDKPSGARMIEMVIGGNELAGKDSAHRLLGGQAMTPGQQATILREEEQIAREDFAIRPLKERLFTTESPYSLTSQIALTAPSDVPGALRHAFAGLLGNPVGKLASSVGSIFTLNRASAQDITVQQSMYNIVAHGYPASDPFWEETDLAAYWEEKCADGKINTAYNTNRQDIDDPEMLPYGYFLDERTNQPVNPTANPCFMLYTLGHYDEPPAGGGGGRSGPITRNGIQLLLNGQPWKFAGVNADTWFGCWPNDIPDDATLDRYFRELNPNSLTRIWPYAHMGDADIMERIVKKAHEYNQYLIVTLFDGNEGQCGTQPIGDVGANMASITPFIERFKKGVHPHADAIGFWELSNESCNGAWFNEMSPLIKAIDPGTLISTGSHAAWCYGGTGEYIEAHRSEAIDLISMHEYDAATGVSHWGGPAAEAARALNKPWFSGEDGFCCGGGDEGQDGNAEKVKVEWQAYIDEPEGAGMLYWDFKVTHPDSATMTFDTPMWRAASEFRHQYNGGAAAAPAP